MIDDALPLSPLARRYQDLLRAAFPGMVLREDDLFAPISDSVSELEWQSRWFAGEFGRIFLTRDGKPVEIVQFGWWNHGGGPDFQDAVVRIDGVEHKGSIEMDRTARDWENHGHSRNPAYEEVVLHLVLERSEAEAFTRTAQNKEVPQVCLERPDKLPPLTTQPEAKPGRCSLSLRHWPEPRLAHLLEAAARYRLERKSQRFRRVAAIHGWDQAMFQGVAEVLGYRQNKLPMTVLAQRFPLKLLIQRKEQAEALLFGASGFLEHVSYDEADLPTQAYLSGIWRDWWKLRGEFAPSQQREPIAWTLSGVRPANHPQRRIAALLEIVREWKGFKGLLQPAHAFVEKDFARFLDNRRHDYWDFHYTLTSKPAQSRMALLGGARRAELLANLVYPALLPDRELIWPKYCAMRAALENEKSRRAALRILADSPHAKKLTNRLYQQQALLQIYDDFCLTDSSDCVGCPFPEQINQW